MFSHTPLGPGPEGLFFESRAQCLSVAVLLSVIADIYFWAPVPTQPFIKLITYTLFVWDSLLRLSTWSLTKLITVVLYYCILPTLRIMLGCIGWEMKESVGGGQLDYGSQRCVRNWNKSTGHGNENDRIKCLASGRKQKPWEPHIEKNSRLNYLFTDHFSGKICPILDQNCRISISYPELNCLKLSFTEYPLPGFDYILSRTLLLWSIPNCLPTGLRVGS